MVAAGGLEATAGSAGRRIDRRRMTISVVTGRPLTAALPPWQNHHAVSPRLGELTRYPAAMSSGIRLEVFPQCVGNGAQRCHRPPHTAPEGGSTGRQVMQGHISHTPKF
jgi:hypothetical protein